MLNIVVCGKFHYDKYLRYLPPEILGKVYFSHRFGERLGLGVEHYVNLPIKEYLQQLHVRIFGAGVSGGAQSFYHLVWQMQLAPVFRPSSQNLFLGHGTSLRQVRAARAAGCQVIVEAVNSHPRTLARLMQEEADATSSVFLAPPSWRYISQELELADYILCPSEFVARSMVDEGIDHTRVHVIPYGCVEGGARRIRLKTQRSGGSYRILCVAQIIPRKGQRHLLQAVARLRECGHDVHVTLVGRSEQEYFRALQALSVPYSYREHVPKQEMLSFMDNFDLLVLPSIEDGFGNVVGEALSAGVPAIATGACGSSEILSRISPDLVVPPANPDALASAIDLAMQRILWPDVELPGWRDYANSLVAWLRSIDSVGERP